MALRRSGRRSSRAAEESSAPANPSPSESGVPLIKNEEESPTRLRSIHPGLAETSQPSKPQKRVFAPNLKSAKQLPSPSTVISITDTAAAASVPHPSVTASNIPPIPQQNAAVIKPKAEPRPLAQNSSFPPPAPVRQTKRPEIVPTKHAGIDSLNPNHPLTLPFDPSSVSEGASKDANNKDKIQTAFADGLFRNPHGEVVGDNNLFFLQLPNKFPIKPGMGGGSSLEDAMDIDEPQKIQNVERQGINSVSPSVIGKIQIMASGKVKFKVNDIVFDVSQGFPVSFLQQVAAINPDDGIYFPLGDVQRRLVVTPDMKLTDSTGTSQATT
jgi:hypothetical protein